MAGNWLRNRITCCYECKKRTMNCHSTCEDYLREREELDRFNEKQRQNKLEKQMLNEIKSEIIAKTKRRFKIK